MRAFLVFGFSRYQSAQKCSLVLVLNEMVLLLERRLRDPCDQCRQVTPSAIFTVAIFTVAIFTVAIVAVAYLRWFIQEGLLKELLNKRR